MILYALKSALLLTLLYGGFSVLLSRETFHCFNRVVLLAIAVLSLVLPAVHVRIDRPMPMMLEWLVIPNEMSPEGKPDGLARPQSVTSAEVKPEGLMRPQAGVLTPASVTADNGNPEGVAELSVGPSGLFPSAPPTGVLAWASVPSGRASLRSTPAYGLFSPSGLTLLHILSYIYIIGVAIALLRFILRSTRLALSLRGGLRSHDGQGNTIIVKGGNFPPFSFMHWIVISVTDYERHRRSILAHEQAHARLGHSWDVLLLELVQVVQWFNPFAWLLDRELKAIHEYEADEAVICQGIDATQYQQLLVIKAVGNRLQLFANTLNRGSLKQRINMMQRTKSNQWRMLRAAFVIPVVLLGLAANSKPTSTPSPREGSLDSLAKLETDQSPLPLGGEGGGLLVEYRTHQKWGKGYRDYYLVHLPEGVWVEGNDGSYIEEQYFSYSFDNTAKRNTTVMQLNGVTFDEHSLPTVSSSELKKIEIKKAEKLTVEGHAQGTNLDISGRMQVVNLITTPVTIPAGVEGNVPRVQTLLLPGKGALYIKNGKAEPGDWMHCSVTDWEPTSYNYSVRNEFEKSKTKPGFKCYIYASTETAEKDISRAEALMRELGITNYEVVRNLPKRHFTDNELRQWAQAQKAKGTAYSRLFDAMAPNHMDCADVHRQWHIVKAVYGKK